MYAPRIVVAFDSFKGSLSSADAGRTASAALRRALPAAVIRWVAVADGGEGTAFAMADTLGARPVHMSVQNPLGGPTDATFYYDNRNRRAIIDTAAASGLPLVPQAYRNPMKTHSYGTGQLIAAAIDMGARQIIVGLGGSATVDCGTGALRALGYRFLDSSGMPLEGGGAILQHIAGIDSSHRHDGIDNVRFMLYSDVENELCGAAGAAKVYGPQKGASPDQCEALEAGCANFARALVLSGYDDTSSAFGAGAAGGIGCAFTSILGAEIKTGASSVLDTIGFDDIILDASLVITGEGCLDASTLYGKTPLAVMLAAKRQGIPVMAIGGMAHDIPRLLDAGFAAAATTKPPEMSLQTAMKPYRAKQLLGAATVRAVKKFFPHLFNDISRT